MNRAKTAVAFGLVVSTAAFALDAQASTKKRPRTPLALDDGHARGPTDAWVTLVVFSDFQCSYCAKLHPTLERVRALYPRDVRIVWKHNPLPMHDRATPTALAAECAGAQSKAAFWIVHDAVFTNPTALDDQSLAKHAQTAAVDINQWQSCMRREEFLSKIRGDQNQAKEAGVRAAPTVFINGRFLSGARTLESFTRIIDQEILAAQKSGVARSRYYQSLFSR
ncbi:MAG: thioredoxin domain-containing protein [Myxococcota bacterium]